MIPVILSGGSGSRLWPLSRQLHPKQFLPLMGDHSFFQLALGRVKSSNFDRPMIVGNIAHRFLIERQMMEMGIQASSVLLEPFGRNTAPAIAIAALSLQTQGLGDTLMLVTPADHAIKNIEAWHESVEQAELVANRGGLVLFGVPADRPETGYGYIEVIEISRDISMSSALALPMKVKAFHEKPSAAVAEAYVKSGRYYWNSGMFLFSADRYLEELRKYSPNIHDACVYTLSKSLMEEGVINIDADSFKLCPDDSIDYAVMEKTQAAEVIALKSDWSDVGNWLSLWENLPKDVNNNAVQGDVILRDSQDSLVIAKNRLVGLIGMKEVAVLETKDAVLVVPLDQVQEVKHLVNQLNEEVRTEPHTHCTVQRPWGSYDSIVSGPRYQVKHIIVNPGEQLSLQMHHHRAEHWIVVSGTAEVTCDDKVFLLTENQSTYIPIASRHILSNPGKIPLEIIEVQSGGYLGEDDIYRFEDIYGRVKTDNRFSALSENTPLEDI